MRGKKSFSWLSGLARGEYEEAENAFWSIADGKLECFNRDKTWHVFKPLNTSEDAERHLQVKNSFI